MTSSLLEEFHDPSMLHPGAFVEALIALSEPPNHRFCTPSVFPDRRGDLAAVPVDIRGELALVNAGLCMAQGEIEGNVACCKLGAQGVNVQRLAAGECHTGGVHFPGTAAELLCSC